MSRLAPPPTSSTTNKTMSSPPSTSSDSVSDSGHSSPNSSRCDSPRVVFDRPLDPSDPLSFFIDPGTTDVHSGSGGDSSAEDSLLTSTPPSSHDSPAGDWSASSTTTTKDSVDLLWPQPDFSSFSLGSFNSMNNMDFLDPALFSSDPLFSMDSTVTGANSAAPADLSSYAFNFGIESFPSLHVPPTDASGRRLSTTSSSSSGTSLSPVNEHVHAVPGSVPAPPHAAGPTPLPPADQAQLSSDRLMDELAVRARQIVGLTEALPLSVDTTLHSDRQPNQHLQHPDVASSSSSIPAPSGYPSFIHSGSSSPAPTSASTNARTKTSHTTIERRYRTNLNARIQSLRAAVPALRVLEVKAGNRVGNLSLKAGTRRVGVDVDADAGEEDVIDERGYIDGVKVARKGSKANVLGKAVEYIHVLKRREMRLKREQDGLKALVRSLVGGPELVQQWETMWLERFGGPEKDEVDGEDGEADDENEDGEDEDDADDKEDESGTTLGKKRKRAKVNSLSSVKGKGRKGTAATAEPEGSDFTQATQPVPILPSQEYSKPIGTLSLSVPMQPEKRKRGRPRKVPLPPVAAPNNLAQNVFATPFSSQPFQQQPVVSMPASNEIKMEVDSAAITQGETQPHSQAQSQPGQQYLLAAFAFFSFFNSPLSYSTSSSWSNTRHATHSHTHSGSVLGDPRPEAITAGWGRTPTAVLTFGWRDAVQLTHLAVSVLLLLSIVLPWLPRLARHIPRALKPIMGVPIAPIDSDTAIATETASDDEYASEGEKADAEARLVLLSALRKDRTLAPVMEAQLLREALGLGPGVLGLLLSLTRQVGSPGKSRSRYGLERRMLEQKAFLRLAELVALDARASVTTRIQAYFYAFKFFYIFSASVTDISTLALVIQPIWRAKSASLWALALNRAQGKGSSSPHICRAYETYILESISVDEAALKVSRLDRGAATYVAKNVDSTCADAGSEEDNEGEYCEPVGPLAVLARQAVRDFVRVHAERIFLQTVPGDEDDHCSVTGAGNCDPDAAEREMRCVIAAGRSLDTRTAALADVFERVCNPTSSRFAFDAALESEEFEDASSESADADIELRALLRAIVLYRRIFPSTLLSVTAGADAGTGCRATSSGISISLTPMPSPPPSPSRRNAVFHLALRRCLDSAAFDRGDALEDARDRVVDMLTAESSGWPKRLQY